MKSMIICLLSIFTFSGFEETTERTVVGTVTAYDGKAIRGVGVLLKGTAHRTVTDVRGNYSIDVPSPGGILVFSIIGFETREILIGKRSVIDVRLVSAVTVVKEEVLVEEDVSVQKRSEAEQKTEIYYERLSPSPVSDRAMEMVMPREQVNTEEYEGLDENIFYGADKKPLSTFSIDVDAASYTNMRRFINNGQSVPKDAVRIEEMINYFSYDYDEPVSRHPFSVVTEIAAAPWNDKHQLVHIGLQGKKIPVENLPASNLVFLIDISGSMNQPNKLPLVKKSFQLLVEQLRAQDHVSMVVYAGAASTLLEPTAGNEKRKILASLGRLQAAGSTAGGAGLRMAYALAKENFKEQGNNRVIIATDGDFNVGEASNEAMEDLIEAERKSGVFLTVLGFGMGNIKDSKMEILADKGNGNYAYVDNLTEARKVLVSEFGGTLFTIAKDVKLQVEFNPAKVLAYRLIGYENRKLQDEDFNNDRKDAGELGSGHTVTALYEIIPVGVRSAFYSIDALKYQPATRSESRAGSADWLTVKLRYKAPGGDESTLLEQVLAGESVRLDESTDNFRWAAAVAAFGMLLRESQFVVDWQYSDVAQLAEGSRGADQEGYRSEFIRLVKTYGLYRQEDSNAGFSR